MTTPKELIGAAREFHNDAVDWDQSLLGTQKLLLLTRHILATVRPDDGEPVTAEWLKAVGFVPLTYEPAGTVGPLRWPTRPDERGLSWHPASDRPEVWVYSDTDSDGIGSAYLPDQPTRGHVRRLCACLGITITETQS